MNFNQSIGRAFDLFSVSEAAQESAHKGGLASTEVSLKIDAQPRHEFLAELRTQRMRSRFVGKRKGYGFMIGHG